MEVSVLGDDELVWGGWTLPIGPEENTAGTPVGREWYKPLGDRPGWAFFRLRATQK
jgi:hypothetical protein